MVRYIFLCPPPIYRIALLPCTFLPAVDFTFSSRLFSGMSDVISAYAFPTLQRVPAVIGLYFFSAIFRFLYWLKIFCQFLLNSRVQVDRFALRHGNQRLLKG